MSVQIHIVDNKKLSMTSEEWEYYQSICKSYDRPNLKGEELFKGLFESDGDGIITFLKPPSTRFTSMECFLFMVSLYNHQKMRIIHSHMSQLMQEIKTAIKELRDTAK